MIEIEEKIWKLKRKLKKSKSKSNAEMLHLKNKLIPSSNKSNKIFKN